MDEMNASEKISELAEENAIRKILILIEDCETIEEVKDKIKELLNK
ncbi:hypothetical protein JDW15_04385 [Aerococcaceae bacterium zg-ZJ1578]|nr:hypothetical protein [Aerococcaceae bacterium zg-1578]